MAQSSTRVIDSVVVTGIGMVTPLGLNRETTFENLVAGRSGIRFVTQFDARDSASKIAGEVVDFEPADFMDSKLAKRIGRYAQLGIAAAREAVACARLDLDNEARGRVACVVSSAIADFPLIEAQMRNFMAGGRARVNPFTVPRASPAMAAALIAQELDLQGAGFATASSCATGSHSIAAAAMLLETGHADVVLAGGAESAICDTFFAPYIAMRALSCRNEAPERASRPFDRDRDGFVLAEGAAVLVLETASHAMARAAPILATLAGVGMSSDAFHITAPHPEARGAVQAINAALGNAGITPSAIDYINAHGTSTVLNDVLETVAVKSVFGERSPPMSSIKSMLGHGIGAAGAIEAATCVMALNRGVVPPTINLDQPDPQCDLDYVPHQARTGDYRYIMSNTFAFGGQNCVLIFRRPEDRVVASAARR